MPDVREHTPEIVYDESDPEHIAPPAEVCWGCSDPEKGIWVPASFCQKAKAAMEERLTPSRSGLPTPRPSPSSATSGASWPCAAGTPWPSS